MATQSLSHWLWAFTEGKGGPGKFGKSHTGRAVGEATVMRIEQECGHLMEPLLLGPTLTNTRSLFWKPTALWQGAKWVERIQPRLSSGRPDIQKDPSARSPCAWGQRQVFSPVPSVMLQLPSLQTPVTSSPITGEPSLQKLPLSRQGLPHVGSRNEKPLGPLECKHARSVSKTPRLVPATHSSLFFPIGQVRSHLQALAHLP